MRHQGWIALCAAIVGGCGADDAFVLIDEDAGGPGPSISSFAGCDRFDGVAWWSDVPASINVATVQDVRAVLCDVEGTPPPDAEGLPCRATSEVWLSDSQVRIRCGAGDPTAGGHRYATVRVVIVP